MNAEPSSRRHAGTLAGREFRYWQRRILISAIIGYALFYFVRKNLSVAMPVMEKELGITKSASRPVSHAARPAVRRVEVRERHRRRPRQRPLVHGDGPGDLRLDQHLVRLEHLGSRVRHSVDGQRLVSGHGLSALRRLMTHWFPPREFATKMAIWNSSHSLGAALIVMLCGYLAPIDWRLCFFVPAAIVLVGAACLAIYPARHARVARLAARRRHGRHAA